VTVVVQHLTNSAFGFPRGDPRRVKPVALACIHITGNMNTAAMTDLHKAARNEWRHANRKNSPGPSAHLYIARDGFAIEAIDPVRFAAWSNGDVSKPNKGNPGIARLLRVRDKGYNLNEAYWEEFECVGFGKKHPITAAQKETMARRIAARSLATGLPIDRGTVHGHFEINGVDRQNCPCRPAVHETFLGDVIAAANDLLAPEGIVNLAELTFHRGVIPKPGRGIFRKPVVDKAELIRNTMADEVLPLVGNTGTGFQIVQVPGEVKAGHIANDAVVSFIDIEPPIV